MVIQLQPEQLVQPTNATHHLVKVRGELVRAQTVKPKCTYDEGVNEEPNPTFKNCHYGKENCIYTSTPLDVNIALMTVGDINILEDAVRSPKGNQRGF